VAGRHGYWARYVKIVDKNDTTGRFYQEIFAPDGKLVSIHEKYPQDRGHAMVEGK
jgi:hypothetical protein